MENITSVKKLIGKWDNRSEFACDVRQNLATVHKWAQFGRIPSEHQAAVVRAARLRGLSQITGDWMIEVHSADRKSSQ